MQVVKWRRKGMYPTCAETKVFLPAWVGSVFPSLFELKYLMVLYCFQIKKGRKPPVLSLDGFIPQSATEMLVKTL